MTEQAMTEFLEAVRTEEAIASGLIQAIGANPETGAAETFACYARACGFPVTLADVEALRTLYRDEDALFEGKTGDAAARGAGIGASVQMRPE